MQRNRRHKDLEEGVLVMGSSMSEWSFLGCIRLLEFWTSDCQVSKQQPVILGSLLNSLERKRLFQRVTY